MKIEVNKNGKKEYYDEFLYVVSMRKKIKKNPNKKVCTLTSYLKKYICLIILSILLFIFFYSFTKDLIFILFIGMLILLLIYVIIYLLNTKNMLNILMKNKGTRIIEINEKCVEYKDEEKNIKVLWNNIELILISKYSICFIPKEDDNIFISISTEYKDKILEGLKKYNKDELIINNL